MRLSEEEVQTFQQNIWEFYNVSARSMPWRDNTEPYFILVSELMLQQTQVDRVIPKFNDFIAVFPDVRSLSEASLAQVLTLWSGLGYNRRAKFLHEAAKMIESDFNGVVPDSLEELVRLPGVGPNTAGAILNYGFNRAVPFVETNIRTVYFHSFFQDEDEVHDHELREIIEQTIDREHPREWHWALMDYGSFLKKQGASRNATSAHYKKQSVLKGSIREVRGQIVKALTKQSLAEAILINEVDYDERFEIAIEGLIKDGLVVRENDHLYLTK